MDTMALAGLAWWRAHRVRRGAAVPGAVALAAPSPAGNASRKREEHQLQDETIPDLLRWWTHGEEEIAALRGMFRGAGAEAELDFLDSWRTALTRDLPLALVDELPRSRLGQVRRDAGRGQLLRDVPPPGAPLDRERGVIAAGEPREPGPQVLPVSRPDLAAQHLPGPGIEVVERDLLTVDIQPAYDGHRDLLKLRRGAGTRPVRIAYAVHSDARLSWGGLRHPAARPQLSPARCMSSTAAPGQSTRCAARA